MITRSTYDDLRLLLDTLEGIPFDNCFKFQRRINNNIGSQITAKCVSIKDYYEKKITT